MMRAPKDKSALASKEIVGNAVPKGSAMGQLPSSKKKALELKENAEHETGAYRKQLQDAAVRHAEKSEGSGNRSS